MTETRTLTDYSDYLRMRRALGHKLARHDRILGSFLDELAAAGQDVITVDAAIRWVCAPDNATPQWWAARLSMVPTLSRPG